MNYLEQIEKEFEKYADPKMAQWQFNYMRQQFRFLGIAASHRNPIIKNFANKIKNINYNTFLLLNKDFWLHKYREMQYAAMYLIKYLRAWEKLQTTDLEFIITTKSWWDTVDFIAPHIVAPYFDLHKSESKKIIDNWLKSDNIWLQRSCILFQLKKKDKTDLDLLLYIIENLKVINEFFIQKAIAWSLREYSKTNANFVITYLQNNKFSNFVRSEALRYLKRKNLV